MVKKVTAKRKNSGITRAELEKIKRNAPVVKADAVDEYLIEEAKKNKHPVFVEYYPGMFSGNKKRRVYKKEI